MDKGSGNVTEKKKTIWETLTNESTESNPKLKGSISRGWSIRLQVNKNNAFNDYSTIKMIWNHDNWVKIYAQSASPQTLLKYIKQLR